MSNHTPPPPPKPPSGPPMAPAHRRDAAITNFFNQATIILKSWALSRGLKVDND